MSKPKAYILLTDSLVNSNAKAGMTVYEHWGWDYGCAADDTRMFGYEHISVTLDPDGGYPFFTVPKGDLSERS